MTSPMRIAAAGLIALQSVALGAATLPIQVGTYVRAGSDCKDPPFAAMMTYDGKAFADPHSHACRSTIIRQEGKAYTVQTSCIAAGEGAGPRVTQTERFMILSRTRLKALGKTEMGRPDTAVFRRCGAIARR